MTKPASRLITLIMLLQRQPNQKAGELAEKLGVSVRTLHRYFSQLDEMGIPIYSERGPAGGFSLMRGYRMPPLVFTPEEATAVYLGTSMVEEIWGRLYHEAAEGALAKMDNVLPEEQRQEVSWARRSLVTAGMQRADMKALAPMLEKLRLAVREQRQVNMLYQSQNRSQPQQRTLDAYALVHRWGWWYVIGFCHLRDEIRTFRIDRILELSLSAQTFPFPPDFDIHRYLENTFSEPGIMISMQFSAEGASIAQTNRSFWESYEELPDGSVKVVFNTPDLYWAASTVLSFGPQARVLDPPELCSMVSNWAQGIHSLYASENEKTPDKMENDRHGEN